MITRYRVMKEKDFYGVVSAIAQFIETADSSGEDYVGAWLASTADHESNTRGRASPALTGDVPDNGYNKSERMN